MSMQGAADQKTEFLHTVQNDSKFKNLSSMMKDRKNVKPVRDPLFIPKATRHMMMKRHFFLVTMFLQVP